MGPGIGCSVPVFRLRKWSYISPCKPNLVSFEPITCPVVLKLQWKAEGETHVDAHCPHGSENNGKNSLILTGIKICALSAVVAQQGGGNGRGEISLPSPPPTHTHIWDQFSIQTVKYCNPSPSIFNENKHFASLKGSYRIRHCQGQFYAFGGPFQAQEGLSRA